MKVTIYELMKESLEMQYIRDMLTVRYYMYEKVLMN